MEFLPPSNALESGKQELILIYNKLGFKFFYKNIDLIDFAAFIITNKLKTANFFRIKRKINLVTKNAVNLIVNSGLESIKSDIFWYFYDLVKSPLYLREAIKKNPNLALQICLKEDLKNKFYSKSYKDYGAEKIIKSKSLIDYFIKKAIKYNRLEIVEYYGQRAKNERYIEIAIKSGNIRILDFLSDFNYKNFYIDSAIRYENLSLVRKLCKKDRYDALSCAEKAIRTGNIELVSYFLNEITPDLFITAIKFGQIGILKFLILKSKNLMVNFKKNWDFFISAAIGCNQMLIAYYLCESGKPGHYSIKKALKNNKKKFLDDIR